MGDPLRPEEPQKDFFEDLPRLGELRSELEARFRAIEQEEAEAAKRLRRRLLRPMRRRPRALPPWLKPVLVPLAALVAVGTAAAAGTLTAKRSAPLSGRIPSSSSAAVKPGFGFSEAGSHYRIVFAPAISAGEAGWRSFAYFASAGHSDAAGGGGEYPTRTNPLAAGEGTNFTSTRPAGGKVLQYVLTGPAVTAVRVGANVVKTRRSDALPAGDRVAVFLLPANHRPVTTSADGSALPSRPTSSGLASSQFPPAQASLRVVALNRTGNPIETSASAPAPASASASRLATVSWSQRGPASAHIARSGTGYAGEEPAARAGASSPRHAATACALRAHGLPGLRPEWGSAVLSVRSIPNASGELLLSCAETTYYLRHQQLHAAILLNASDPGRRPPGPIPGARPVSGRPGAVNAALGKLPGDITARRAHNAWLVVEGGRSLAQRLEALAALEIAKLPPGG